jgi:hypothetical protein
MSSLKRISFIALTCSEFFTKSLNDNKVNEGKNHKRKLKLQNGCNTQPNFLVRYILLFSFPISEQVQLSRLSHIRKVTGSNPGVDYIV